LFEKIIELKLPISFVLISVHCALIKCGKNIKRNKNFFIEAPNIYLDETKISKLTQQIYQYVLLSSLKESSVSLKIRIFFVSMGVVDHY